MANTQDVENGLGNNKRIGDNMTEFEELSKEEKLKYIKDYIQKGIDDLTESKNKVEKIIKMFEGRLKLLDDKDDEWLNNYYKRYIKFFGEAKADIDDEVDKNEEEKSDTDGTQDTPNI